MPTYIDAEEVIPAIGRSSDAAAIPSLTTSIVSIVKKIYESVVSLLTSVLTLTETGGTMTTDGTEQNVYINNAPAGVYDPKIVQIAFANHTLTETVVIKEYYRISSGGGWALQDSRMFIGAQAMELMNIELEENRFGVKVTIEKTAGTNRDYDYEAVYRI